MEKRISGFKTITFAGFTALLLLSGCATTKPVASKNTPQQLIMQNRKAEAVKLLNDTFAQNWEKAAAFHKNRDTK